MTVGSPTVVRTPRLNPFAFPSDTDFRFVLLILAVLGSSMFIYNALYFSYPPNQEQYLHTILACRNVAEAAYPNTDIYTLIARNAAFAQCRAPAEQTNAAWIVSGVALLLAVAGVIYSISPAWKIWRGKLTPLDIEDAPEVVAYLADLCREAGLARPPIFVWNPFNPASSGLAFGRLGRYYVALSGGLVTQFYTDQPAFRAVVLHELAHLRNADVDKAYFTVAIWQAFVVVALIPFVGAFLVSPLDFILNSSWRALALTMLVYLTRSAVLRAREMYADVRASVWDGPAGALGRVLEALPPLKAGRWWRVLQVHPDPAERRRVLGETHQLFRMGLWEACGTGIVAAIALPNVVTLVNSFLTGTQLTYLAQIVAALIFTPLAVGVVGLGVWRMTFAALAQGEMPSGLDRLALGLGMGFILGQTLSFGGYVQSLLPSASGFIAPYIERFEPKGIALLAFNILWSSLLLGSLCLFLRWIAAGASVWLEVAATGRSPRPAYGVGLTIAGGLLAVWSGALFFVRDHKMLLLWLLSNETLGTIWLVVQNPFTLLVLMSLWAFPLAAWFWRGRVALAAGPGWAFLSLSSEPLALLRQAPLRPGMALIIGLVGGLVFCESLLVIRLVLRLGLPEATRGTAEFRLMFFLGQIALAALMQVGVAAIVASWVRRLGGMHGLLAAFIAGCVMTMGILGLNLLFGGTIDLTSAWNIFSQVVNAGALLALPVVLALSALGGMDSWFDGATQASTDSQ